MSFDEQAAKINKIIAQAGVDNTFRERLQSDPSVTLRQEGVELPAGVNVRIVENTDDVFYLVLPKRAVKDEVSEKELSAVAAGLGPIGPPFFSEVG